MYLEMTECHIPFLVTLNLTSDLVLRIIVSISLIFFEVGIPSLVCICILVWGKVTYHFQGTVTLTSDLVLIIIVSGAYHSRKSSHTEQTQAPHSFI